MKKPTFSRSSNIQFSDTAKRDLRGLMHFTGWSMKEVVQRALKLANQNRGAFVAGQFKPNCD